MSKKYQKQFCLKTKYVFFIDEKYVNFVHRGLKQFKSKEILDFNFQ